MRRAILLAVVVAGCAEDPCANVSGTCLTLEVTGDVGDVDTLGITLSGVVTFAHASPLPAGATTLPVLVGIELPDGNGAVHAVGLVYKTGTEIAQGSLDIQVTLAAPRGRGNDFDQMGEK